MCLKRLRSTGKQRNIYRHICQPMCHYIYYVYMNYTPIHTHTHTCTHTHTHTYTDTITHILSHKHIMFIYCLRFPTPCVVCNVLLDLGKFIRKKQQTAALIVFSAQKMRFPMKQVHACMQKEMLNLNPSLSKLELCYGLHGN